MNKLKRAAGLDAKSSMSNKTEIKQFSCKQLCPDVSSKSSRMIKLKVGAGLDAKYSKSERRNKINLM